MVSSWKTMKRAAAGTKPGAPSPPPPRGSRSPSAAASPSAPPFGRLLLAGLRSVGLDGVSLDVLRRAKKNAVDAHEYARLWRLLHDLVLVALLDFDVDVDAMRETQATPPPTADSLAVHQELARHYLYEWGFVSRAFYATHEDAPASVLLLALAWLLAHTRFFERQHHAILAVYMQSGSASTAAMPRLPPYRNDVMLPVSAVMDAVAQVVESSERLGERIRGDFDRTARLNQLQVLLGRIHAHHRTLQSARGEFGRMLTRLEEKQRANGATDEAELLPAYALQVFADGKSQLELHVRVLSERLQMIEDEKLFYKWINGLVLQYAPLSSDTEDATAVLESQYVTLYADIVHAKTALERSAELFQHLANLHAVEKKKWQQKAKTRTQQAKMDEKMDKLRHDIMTNELVDATALFLDRKRESKGTKDAPTAKTKVQFVEDSDLERLQNQLERVMQEITTQYCRVDLI